MKFNMGCGARKLPGFLNVDGIAACEPDELVDLEVTPWPWPTDCADEIIFNHSLEHMGADPKIFLSIMAEIYRIADAGCIVQINVPHPRHDNFISDPTHVRAITPQMLCLFDKRLCDEGIRRNAANTPFAHYLGVDFELTHTHTVVEEPFLSQYRSGVLSEDALRLMLRTQLNIAREFKMTLRVRKDHTAVTREKVAINRPPPAGADKAPPPPNPAAEPPEVAPTPPLIRSP
ncbi:MAG TPA: hypothetical protein VNW53_15035 [Phenylobacterium sp.]|jgi:hypothetical protein|uniref:hypothetical protein n=1 Tax=Phenylobacterium sp. TaxID=1871053 RepID=UPI002CE9E60B|nr:hypothetical protein [Phenylobacterium sp.]HXA40310.1 hypothetical protein [Phenylobacterium sp.]